MTRDEAINLMREGSALASAQLSPPQLVPGMGWVHNSREIEQAMRNGLALFIRGNRLIDERGDDPTEGEARQACADLVHGALTMAAACLLYLEECPIPYDIAKQMRVIRAPS